MDQQRVDMYLATNQKYFPAAKIPMIRERLLMMDENRFMVATSIDFKDPTTMLIISIFLGELGVDRFMLGDVGMGILKLLTAGVCGILWIIDLIQIMDKTKEANFNLLYNSIM